MNTKELKTFIVNAIYQYFDIKESKIVLKTDEKNNGKIVCDIKSDNDIDSIYLSFNKLSDFLKRMGLDTKLTYIGSLEEDKKEKYLGELIFVVEDNTIGKEPNKVQNFKTSQSFFLNYITSKINISDSKIEFDEWENEVSSNGQSGVIRCYIKIENKNICQGLKDIEKFWSCFQHLDKGAKLLTIVNNQNGKLILKVIANYYIFPFSYL